MNLNSIANCILDESSSTAELREALDAFSRRCSEITGIQPASSFNAWADDSLLDSGVAISPQAAAHCVADYQRSVVFIRGIYAAIKALKHRFPDTRLEILYAGCGPFATLLLPLVGRFSPGELEISLLDIHRESLDSVGRLIPEFGLDNRVLDTIQADACHYKHPRKLHLVITETMQKSLEQEPQFAVTANLAPQLVPGGVFIPQRIDVALCLAELAHEKALLKQSQRLDPEDLGGGIRRYSLATVFTLTPHHADDQLRRAQCNVHTKKHELEPVIVEIPALADIVDLDAALFTRIAIFEQYRLADYESQITLPLKCHELATLKGGERYRVSYQLGSYPRFDFVRLN